jgi:phenylalanyl-tRNA synthetase beta chain
LLINYLHRSLFAIHIMTISFNWLKEYLKTDKSAEEIAELLTDLGLEVEGLEEIGGFKNDLTGVVVGYVVECAKHPDADRLSLTRVDIGGETLLSIVCGAANVQKGQKVAVATIGTTLQFADGNVVKIKAGKIRGEVSEGMICAEDELGIGTDHSGIMVLPENTPIGVPIQSVLKIESDTIIEIGLTPNRSDAMCHLGVARDLAARLTMSEPAASNLVLPDISKFKVSSNALKINVLVEDFSGCPRYSGVCISGVKIGDSPQWLKQRLEAIGVNSRNNVVDITNFVLHELGQPLHAFDYDKIGKNTVVVKNLPAGTPFLSLKKNEAGENVTLKLDAEDLMICDGNNEGMCLAGVIGNPIEGVSDTTTRIFLESAHFEGKRLRRSSFRHNTRTDAAKTYEKGTDPNLTVFALKRATQLIVELAGGEIASEVVDIYPTPIEKTAIELRYAYVNRLIGQELAPDYVKKILAALDIDILQEHAAGLCVSVPTNKPDVLREADVVEEILRIHGFNAVPMPNYIRSAVVKSEQPNKTYIRNLISDFLSASGFNEMMAMSLSQSNFYATNAQLVENETLVRVANTSNIHLDILRPTMVVSVLEAIEHNQNRQIADLKLYEFGRTYAHNNDAYTEAQHLGIALSGRTKPETWLSESQAKTDFFTLKTLVNRVLARLGIGNYQETVLSDAPFEIGLKYHRGAQVLVSFGKIQTKLKKNFNIKQDVYFADFEWDNVIKALKNAKVSYEEVNRFPQVRRDLALVLDTNVAFADIALIAKKTAKTLLKDINLFDVFDDAEKLGVGKKSYAVSFIFEDKEKTLQEKDIEKIMSELITRFETQLNALIRR